MSNLDLRYQIQIWHDEGGNGGWMPVSSFNTISEAMIAKMKIERTGKLAKIWDIIANIEIIVGGHKKDA